VTSKLDYHIIRLQYSVSINMALRRQYDKTNKVTASREHDRYLKYHGKERDNSRTGAETDYYKLDMKRSKLTFKSS